MNKPTVMLIVLMMIGIGFLSGCEQQPTKATDADGDGHPDDEDAFPNDITEWVDSDADGYGDTSDTYPTDKTEWKDTDTDGYGDNGDDFPSDPDVHEKIVLLDAYDTYALDPEQGHTGNGSSFVVDRESKYVVVNWDVMHSLSPDEYKDIYFDVTNPSGHTSYTYGPSNCTLHLTVDSSNWGQWEYRFHVGLVAQNITIDREIYIAK